MSAPNYSAADYLSAMQALMPRGRVWPKDSDATQTQVLGGLVQVYARNTARANNLLVDAFPGMSAELLPEWEATLGLPDPCAGVAPTVAARNAQVLARFTGLGGSRRRTTSAMRRRSATRSRSQSLRQRASGRAG